MNNTMRSPDARQLTALQAQLGVLEDMLRVLGGGGKVPNNVVPMPVRQNPMQQQMMENMLAGVDPQRGSQIRALMAVAQKPSVSQQEMDAAVAPLLGQLTPADQATVRMMLSMMQQQQQPPQAQAATPAAALALPAPAVTQPPDLQQMLDQVTARAATALEESRRVAAELVVLKDTQNQTAAAMHQQTQVMRDLLQMLKVSPSPAADPPVTDDGVQDAAS